MRDGWFATGDVATRAADGYIRIVGPARDRPDQERRLQDRRGRDRERAASSIPAVAESAVTGEPDDDLGERIVAWVVRRGRRRQPSARRSWPITSPRLLTPHKRPREVRYLDALPRNAMGKVTKATLGP